MPYDEEEENVIRHGTVQQWLKYKVSVGPLEVAGQWLALAAVLVVLAVEHLVF